jgi:hypothetical protein
MALLNQKKGVEYALRDKGYIECKGVNRNGVELWALNEGSASAVYLPRERQKELKEG